MDYYSGKDDWFDKYWSKQITAEFAIWWEGFYGLPTDYLDTPDEIHEYFVRMAFAFRGWEAGKEYAKDKSMA